jgi:hypothetical protein
MAPWMQTRQTLTIMMTMLMLKKMGNAPPDVQQTTQSQGTTNSNKSNSIKSDSNHPNNDAPAQKDDKNVSYFVTF